MGNYLLKPVYESIFGNVFRSNYFEDRMQMQKSIYLLQELGLSVGDYDFKWYKHGPYSQSLQNDILNSSGIETVPISYSADAKVVIEALKAIIFQDGISYDTCKWLECLGSLHYIKDNLLPSSASTEDVLTALESRKPHLDCHSDNKKALLDLEKLFA